MASNEVIIKTKVVFRFNHFVDNINEHMISQYITIGSHVWRVVVRADNTSEIDFVMIAFQLVKTTDGNNKSVDSEMNTYVMDSEDKPLIIHRYRRQTFQLLGALGSKLSIPLSQMLDQSDKYLPNNTLTIVCDINVFMPTFGPKRRRHFGNSFNNKDLNDCRVFVGDKQLFASKAILSGRSEVFEKMFTTDMSEKDSNEVISDDIDADVFEEFLRFLHFGDSDKLYEMSAHLLHVSDKYMVSDLKTICENLYYLRINPKNAFKVMKMLDKYGNQELVAKSMSYIKTNLIECLEDEWHNLFRTDPKSELILKFNTFLNQTTDNNTNNSNNVQTLYYTYMPGV